MFRASGVGLVVAICAASAAAGVAHGQSTTRASVATNGDEGDYQSSGATATLSSDGQTVAFTSFADDLVANDANGVSDVFVRALDAGTTERVSVDSSGAEANDDCFDPAISADGRFVAFDSAASNLVANDGAGFDVFVHDRLTGTTERVSVDSSGNESNGDCTLPAISGDGSVVAFVSTASNLVANDLNGLSDAFVHDRTSGVTERVSVDSSGVEADGRTFHVALSQDGNVAAFDTDSTNLDANDDSNPLNVVVFAHDRTTGVTERVSVGSGGTLTSLDSTLGAVSEDGRFVTFASDGILVSDDSGAFWDVFVHDRLTGITSRASVDSAGAEANGASSLAAVTPDGKSVAFTSDASNLVSNDGNGSGDVFVRARLWIDAAWSNYGAGLAGTNGVPAFTSRAAPLLGTSVTLDLENSSGIATTAVLFIGFDRATLPSVWGGVLLVAPFITDVVALQSSTTSFTGDLPPDESLLGVTVDLQAIEADAGAVRGVSFTPGLELLLGY